MRIGKIWECREFQNPKNPGERLHCWGFSNTDVESALKDARERSERVIRKILGMRMPADDDYCADIIEEIVETLSPESIVTRNRYGARILNTQEIAIFDIDAFPPPRSSKLSEFFRRFFGYGAMPHKTPKEATFEHISRVLASKNFPSRIYETAAGFRVLINAGMLSPKSDSFRVLARQLRADVNYTRLCAKQNCFRARLTPKPYRAQIPACRYHWPQSPEEYARNQAWVKNYEMRAREFSVCRLVHACGNDFATHALVRFHDAATCRPGKLA